MTAVSFAYGLRPVQRQEASQYSLFLKKTASNQAQQPQRRRTTLPADTARRRTSSRTNSRRHSPSCGAVIELSKSVLLVPSPPVHFLRCFSEWATNQHRDSIASHIGHSDLLSYFAVAENNAVGRVRYQLLEVIISAIFTLSRFLQHIHCAE